MSEWLFFRSMDWLIDWLIIRLQEKAALKKLENVKSDHAKRLDDLEKEQTTDMQKAQLIEVNLSLVTRIALIVKYSIGQSVDQFWLIWGCNSENLVSCKCWSLWWVGTSWHQQSMKRILEVGLGGQCTPRGRPHNPTTGLCSSLTTVVSPDSWTIPALDKVTAVPVRRNGNFQTPISVPAVRPKRCHTLSNPAHRQDYTVACLNYTLQTMMPLPGWPAMAPNA